MRKSYKNVTTSTGETTVVICYIYKFLPVSTKKKRWQGTFTSVKMAHLNISLLPSILKWNPLDEANSPPHKSHHSPVFFILSRNRAPRNDEKKRGKEGKERKESSVWLQQKVGNERGEMWLVRALRFLGSDSSPRSYFFSFPPGLFGVWVFLFYFLLLAVFFFNLLIANPTVGGYFFFGFAPFCLYFSSYV